MWKLINIKDILFIIIQPTFVCVTPCFVFRKMFGEKGEATPQSNIKEVSTASSSQPEEGPGDGERMTAELRGIISQFMQKVSMKTCQDSTKLQTTQTIYELSSIQVEEFKLSVSNMSVSTTEQQMVSIV